MDSEILTIGRGADAAHLPALRDIFTASYRPLVLQMYGVVGDFAEAEDLVQEAFVRAAASGLRFLRVDNHEAWLRTTALNLHRNRWRKLRNHARARERMAAPSDPPDLDSRVDVIDALRGLPEGQRQVVALHYFGDLSVDEIAHTLGVAPGTVKSRLSRGREHLAKRLSHEGSSHV